MGDTRELLNQRGWDLLRQMRMKLHEEDLITDEEYALLAVDHPAVKRLENYDVLRQQVESLRAELAWNQAANDAIWSELVTRGLASEIGPDKLRSLKADSKIHAACEKQLAAEKQRADALEAALRRVIAALLKLSERGEEGKALLLGNPLKYEDCYFAWLGLNHALCDAKDLLLDAARKPVPQEPAK